MRLHHTYFGSDGASRSLCPTCRAADGTPKTVYRSPVEAAQTASHRRWESGVHLQHYKCPSGHGWHLTKA